ncbi:MAG: DUF4010 domain-containing protein [Microgenomates group bacterium]
MEIPILAKIIISLILGSAVGFERESYENQTNKTANSGRGSLGVRSYALISLLGVLSGLVYTTHLVLFILVASIFFLLLSLYYFLGSWHSKDNGMTTELAIVLTFLFGVFLATNILPVQLIIALTVVLILILSLKTEIKSLVSRVQNHELDAFISYALITLVILPFLPNQAFSLATIPALKQLVESFSLQLNGVMNVEIINPFNLWKVVAIITGIDIVGYILEKTVGQKNSWVLTSIAGGFISSTSTTQSLAIRSTKSKNVNGLVAAALFANVSSFIQHFLLISSMNTLLLVAGIPYLVSIIVSGLVIALFFYKKSGTIAQTELKSTKKDMNAIHIFALKPALQFAVVFTFIKFFSKISLQLFGQNGFYITTALASFTGIDAVTLSVGEIAGSVLTYQAGIVALIFANAINLLAKTLYCFLQGSKPFAIRFGLSSVVIIAMSIASFLLFK